MESRKERIQTSQGRRGNSRSASMPCSVSLGIVAFLIILTLSMYLTISFRCRFGRFYTLQVYKNSSETENLETDWRISTCSVSTNSRDLPLNYNAQNHESLKDKIEPMEICEKQTRTAPASASAKINLLGLIPIIIESKNYCNNS